MILATSAIMASNKKQKTDAGALTATPNKDKFFDHLEATVKSKGAKGPMMIVGIEGDEDDEDEEDDEKPEVDYSEEQLATLRYVLITNKREKALDKFMQFADPDDGFFTTSTGNQIIMQIPGEVNKILKMKAIPDRFDALFALTYCLNDLDMWMNDNECWEEGGDLAKAVKVLGNAWKNLLKSSDAELGIDAEFTRPGTLALLSKFEDSLAVVDKTFVYA